MRFWFILLVFVCACLSPGENPKKSQDTIPDVKTNDVVVDTTVKVSDNNPEPGSDSGLEDKMDDDASVVLDDVVFSLTSPVFKDSESIPVKYTCQGDNISPPLKIEGVPMDAKSIVLMMDDPDAPAGIWDHWIIWDINPTTSDIQADSVPRGGIEGLNSFRKTTYSGPCPPSGVHRYFFKLYALDKLLGLQPISGKNDVLSAMDGHILAETKLLGTYKKS